MTEGYFASRETPVCLLVNSGKESTEKANPREHCSALSSRLSEFGHQPNHLFAIIFLEYLMFEISFA